MNIKVDDVLKGLRPVEIYMYVLNENVDGFPFGYWKSNDAKDKASQCIKYLIEEVLCWTDDDIYTKFNKSIFEKYKLRFMVNKCFEGSYHKALIYTYPDRLKIRKFKNKPPKYCTKENFLADVMDTLKEKNLTTKKEIKENVNSKFFIDNGLSRGWGKFFNQSSYEVLNTLFLDKYSARELQKAPQGYWTEEHLIDEIRDIVSKGNYTVETVVNMWNTKLINSKKLRSGINSVADGSLSKALEMAIPNIFKINQENPKIKVRDII